MRMSALWTSALALPLLAACATPPEAKSVAVPTARPLPVLSVVAAPFVIAFKLPACVLTTVVAGAVGGASELTPPDESSFLLRQNLEDGLEQNCGPPYTITP
jgi:hypothetical protein